MRRYPLILLLFSGISFTACVKERDLSENTVVAHMSGNPNGLHPTNSSSGYRQELFEYLHKTLLRIDIRSQQLVPVLADSLPWISEDGKQLFLRIRKDVKWDDGSPLTVEDIIFSSKLVIAPLTRNPMYKGLFLQVMKEVRADPNDPYGLILETFEPYRGAHDLFMEIYILQKNFWDPKGITDQLSFANCFDASFQPSPELSKWFDEFNGPDNAREPSRIVGLGPYRLKEWVDDNYLILEKKEKWWGDNDSLFQLQNYPDKIMFRIIKDESAVYYALRNQNLDAISRVALSKFTKLKQHDYFNSHYKAEFLDYYAYNYLGMNMKPDGVNHKPFFTDLRVRQAMAHIVPVEDIIQVLYKGHAKRMVSNVSPIKTDEYNHQLQPIPHDLNKAAQLLDAAGWKDRDGDRIREKEVDGELLPFRFKLNYMSDGPPSKEICLMIKNEAIKVGIDVVPNPMEFGLFYEKAYAQDFDAVLGAWLGSAAFEDFSQLWHTSMWSGFGPNFCGFGNASTDSLIASINAEMNDSLYRVKVKEFQRVVYETQPYVFLFAAQARVAIHKRFEAEMYSEKPNYLLSTFQLKQHSNGITNHPDK